MNRFKKGWRYLKAALALQGASKNPKKVYTKTFWSTLVMAGLAYLSGQVSPELFSAIRDVLIETLNIIPWERFSG